MEYVFFDIECACVYKNVAKICVFGYCVCDEQFNIIKKEDILINPNGKFHLTDRGGDGIVLPYDYAEFKKYPPFPHFYPKIRSLLEGEDKLVFGHAAVNDVKYLCLETRRYKLPSFSFRFADTQIIYMAMTKTFDRQAGLEELLERCSIRPGRINDYQFSNCSSQARAKYISEKVKEKREKGEKRARFNDFVFGYRVKPQSREFKGRRFSFSRSIEEDLPLAKRLVKAIVARGGRYSLKLTGCNVFVEEDGDDSVRRDAAHKLHAEGAIAEIYKLSEFKRLLWSEEE